jgi:uncharacterized Tic20 family protein
VYAELQVLALPFAFKSTGAVLGVIVLGAVYVLILCSIELLVASTKLTTNKSYAGIATAAMGKWGNYLAQGATFLATFGAMTSYLIIIGDMMGPLIGLWMGGTNDDYCSMYARRQFPITCALFIVIPLSMLRNIDSLRYTSGVAVAAVIYLLLVVVYKSGESIDKSASLGFTALSIPILCLHQSARQSFIVFVWTACSDFRLVHCVVNQHTPPPPTIHTHMFFLLVPPRPFTIVRLQMREVRKCKTKISSTFRRRFSEPFQSSHWRAFFPAAAL